MRRPFRCSREIGRSRGASDFVRQNCGLDSDDSRVGRFWRSAPKPGSDDRLASAELPPSPPSSVLGRFPSHPARRRSEPARAEDAAGSRASKLPGRRPTCRRAVGNRTPDLSVLLAKLPRANLSARIRPNPTRWPVGSSRWGGRSSERPDGQRVGFYPAVGSCGNRDRSPLAVRPCRKGDRSPLSVRSCGNRGRSPLAVRPCGNRDRSPLSVRSWGNRGRTDRSPPSGHGLENSGRRRVAVRLPR